MRDKSRTTWNNTTMSISVTPDERGDKEPVGGMESIIAQFRHTLIGLGYSEKTVDRFLRE